jgi:Kef-type K+ transport system membrane component KefB
MPNSEFARLFFLQFVTLLVACRALGWLAKKVGQPQVVAEMIAGIVLGPSLFGLIFPDAQAALFPKESMTPLYVISQLGLVLYMFLVGTELEMALVTGRIGSALSIAAAGTALPLALGAILSIWLAQAGGFFGPQLSTWQAGLYVGAAMSVTAFPVLARIIQERGIDRTPIGAISLAAGAIDDVLAWCLLAAVLASVDSNPAIALRALLGGAAFVLVAFFILRPLFALVGKRVDRMGAIDGTGMALVLLGATSSAWFTETIGIHAVFGAFVFGLVMPRGLLIQELTRTLLPMTIYVVIPLFFVYSGLNTRIGLITSPSAWALTGLIVLIASVGKTVACSLAARFAKHTTRDSLAIGVLMNARGLMELVVLNIGLERGLISPTFFTMMVVMAILTTVTAGPLFDWIYRPSPAVSPLATSASAHKEAVS